MTECRDATHGESIRSQRVPCQKCFLLQDKTERSQKVCNATRPAPKSMLRKYAGSGRSLRGAKSWLSWGHQKGRHRGEKELAARGLGDSGRG